MSAYGESCHDSGHIDLAAKGQKATLLVPLAMGFAKKPIDAPTR
jgi:hypothetical protein